MIATPAISSPRRTRVLMTADAVGGVWTYAMELAAATAGRGCEFIVAVMGPGPSAAQAAEAAALGNVRLECAPYRLEWMESAWGDVDEAGRWLLALAGEHGAGVVHLNGYAHGAVEFGAPTVVVGHSCVLSWCGAVRAEAAGAEWEEYRSRARAGLEGADAVVAPTRWMLDQLGRWYGPGAVARGRVIANGRACAGAPARKEPIVLAAGRLWDEAKNIGALARAAGAIPWRCVVAGDVSGPARGGEPARAGLECLGRLAPAEMRAWMGRASIFVHPARYEPFGLAALEAGLAGCALVLGDIPPLREVWGDAPVYVDPGDAAGLARAVRGLIDRPLARERTAIACRRRAAFFSRERLGAAYAGLYGELVARGRVRRAAADAAAAGTA